jgi:hypothetical protein
MANTEHKLPEGLHLRRLAVATDDRVFYPDFAGISVPPDSASLGIPKPGDTPSLLFPCQANARWYPWAGASWRCASLGVQAKFRTTETPQRGHPRFNMLNSCQQQNKKTIYTVSRGWKGPWRKATVWRARIAS